MQQEKSPVSVDPTLTRERKTTDLVLHQLVGDVLGWCKYVDIAYVAGRLLKTIFSSHRHEMESMSEIGSAANTDEPVWFAPILNMAKDDFGQVEKLERHVLSQLLAIDERSLIYLVQQLPFRQLLSGDNGGVQEVSIEFSI